jgi:hypothetical protein
MPFYLLMGSLARTVSEVAGCSLSPRLRSIWMPLDPGDPS